VGKDEELLFPRRKERMADRRKEGDQRKLLDEFFDHSTLMTISRLVSRGHIGTIDYPIATGKEGGVFRASGPEGFRAVKIYRIGNTMFRRLPAYVLEQLKREASLGNFGRLVAAWTRREHTILGKLHGAGVRVPQPFTHLRNVLVMEFIGTDGVAAPRLQQMAILEPNLLRDELAAEIRRMVVEAHLVHGDLSPYNVLLHEGHPVLIDVAQAIPSDHPEAPALLARDSHNFAKYLRKVGADTTPDEFLRLSGGPLTPNEG
jgi:RIO kinase 1